MIIGSSERIYALDALRVVLMCLGFLFHAIFFLHGLSYQGFASVVKIFLHLFRMPAFFMLAGYFAQMVYRRYGFWGFIYNRQRRLLVPLVILVTLSILPHFLLVIFIYLGQLSINKSGFPLAAMWNVNISLSYVWFLLYLFAMELIFVVFKALTNILPLRVKCGDVFLKKPYVNFTVFLLFFMSSVIFLNIKPLLYFTSAFDGFGALMVLHFFYYFCFFIWGAFLFYFFSKEHIRIKVFLWLAISCLAFAGYYLVYFSNLDLKLHFIAFLQCLFAWSMSLFFWNLSYIAFNHSKSWLRYLSESSYSLYLLQVPIMIFLFKYVVGTNKAYFNSLGYAFISFVISLIVYHFFIRGKWFFRYIDGFQKINR